MNDVLASSSFARRAWRRRHGPRVRGAWAGAVLMLLGAACAAGTSPPGASPASLGERVQQLALGAYHTCAVSISGRVACWGDNQQGQLGNGGEQPSTTPVWVSGLDDVVEIRAGEAATCARRRSGRIACWGGNAHGEAAPHAIAESTAPASSAAGAWDRSGEPPSYAPGNVRRTPTELAELSGARALAMGSRHGCVLDGAGHVTCWGDGTFGQLGPGAEDGFQLRAIAGLPPLVELSAAGERTCGRTAAGEVWCWGDSEASGTALESSALSSAPVERLSGAARFQVFDGRACAWSQRGDATCWGDSGACADTGRPSPPTPVPDYRGALALARAAGGCFWCVLRPSHVLSCDRPPPASGSLELTNVQSVVAGNDHACAIRDDGGVWCWGANVRGELGRATPAPRDPNPAPVEWAR